MKLCILLLFILLITVGTCVFLGWVLQPSSPFATTTISIHSDLFSVPPLLLKPNVSSSSNSNDFFYLPDEEGRIIFTQGQLIKLSCPLGKIFFNGKNLEGSIVHVVYIGLGKQFQVVTTKEKGLLYQFNCTGSHETARFTGKSCLGGFKEIEIGFKVDPTLFIRQLTICFDPKKQSTAYSAYNLTKSIRGYQTGTPRPNFHDGNFYDVSPYEIEALYSRNVQRRNVNKQVGLPKNSNKYIADDDHYLSRGHLTAKADFIYGAQHNATFYYVNAAPQWQTFNGGNWNELELSVRYLAGSREIDLEVFTGTHGVMTLPHEKTGQMIAIYFLNESGRKGVPVPRMYWKVIYDRRTKAGIAFVGLNNPYNRNVHQDALCVDICDQIKYRLSWNRTNLLNGYGYCCNVNELRQKVKNIPYFVVKSNLL